MPDTMLDTTSVPIGVKMSNGDRYVVLMRDRGADTIYQIPYCSFVEATDGTYLNSKFIVSARYA